MVLQPVRVAYSTDHAYPDDQPFTQVERKITTMAYQFRSEDTETNRNDMKDTLNSFAGVTLGAIQGKAIVTTAPDVGGFTVSYVPWHLATVTERARTIGYWVADFFDRFYKTVLKPVVETVGDLGTNAFDFFALLKTLLPIAVALLFVAYLVSIAGLGRA